MTKKQTILWLALLTLGLSVGVFYTFSVAINPALQQLSDSEYIHAMQAINRVIENPLFFAAFFGAFFLLPWAAYLAKNDGVRRFRLLVAAAILYGVGVVGVTSAANVPLNQTLARTNLQTASPAELATTRGDYQAPWTAWHTVRTVSGTLAFAAAITATMPIKKKKEMK